ncbi:RNA-binding protein 33-like isoform X2 [Plodia interpunctella]|uniref:RNA-binding protein 33-like isoform X2 n=1 Tax=Plodia interpunctella TaxID=58824 RepID=UPI002368BE60|nr:RNA-binding protein 33-like isoform X2 [Plodia interpunctella]
MSVKSTNTGEFNMSDNEDLLGDDLCDQSLADYNLGNEEEDQLLADDYESGSSQNVPTSLGPSYVNSVEMVPNDFVSQPMEYNAPLAYQPLAEPECVVPNITVEVPNTPLVPPPEFPFEPQPPYGPELAVVPPPIPAAVPIESSQIVPSELVPPVANGEVRPRFVSERAGARQPRVRDIPDSLDKVIVRGQRGRGGWRQRFPHPYHRNNMHRVNFNHRPSFPPHQLRASPPQIRPEIRPEMPEIRPDPVPIAPPMPIRPELSPERPMLQEVPFRPENPPFRPENPQNPPLRPDNPPFRQENPSFRPEPLFGPENPQFRPENPPFGPNFRFQFRPEERNFRPNFNPYPRQFGPRHFGPPIREIAPNNVSHMPQVTIRQPLPVGREPEVRMLPLQLPPNLPPGGLAGKKVLINPHFKGNFQPPVEGLPPAYIPTRINKSPPISPTLESKFGPIKDIDDAAERFIAEQRNALARAATRKFRRSPQRYIENTTIEIENELAAPTPVRRNSDDELLRRQEEFINANRAGLRRRMRTPSPETPREPLREPPREPRDIRRRSLSPRRSPERRRTSPVRDEESEYRRKMREQENLRERVLRAKEFRRRKNAVAATQTSQNSKSNDDAARNRDRDRQERDKEPKPKTEDRPVAGEMEIEMEMAVKPDSTEKEKLRARSPVRSAEVNSTSETLTPPRENLPKTTTPEPAMTPPLPEKLDKSAEKSTDRLMDSDDDLDLILGDIDGILSDDEDSGRFKDKAMKSDTTPSKTTDLRNKLPPRPIANVDKQPKQRIVFNDAKKKGASPPRRAAVSSTAVENIESEANKTKQKLEVNTNKSRARIIFERKEQQQQQQQEKKDTAEDRKPQTFANRRVILQTKLTQQKEKSVFSRIEKTDPSKPNPCIFSRAVRTAIGGEKTRIVVKKDEPTVEYGTDDTDEEILTALVSNLPDGMTDTRLKTLAGSDVQTLILDKDGCSAKITFKSSTGAELFKKKFHNKMVSKSRLIVKLT